MKKFWFKHLVFIIAVIIGLWLLYPTYKLYTTPEKELSDWEKKQLHKKSLHLGLDLVGGMHMVLDVDVSKLDAKQRKDATDRALEVIRNRIDQFGVYEPVIQKIGDNRILVQLPGVDRKRAKELIGQTAQLKFIFLEDKEKIVGIFSDIARKIGGSDTTNVFLKYMIPMGADMGVYESNIDTVMKMINLSKDILKRRGDTILFGPSEEYQGKPARRIYVLKNKVELTGDAIMDARPSPYQGNEAQLQGTWIVSLNLHPKYARKFAKITGDNIGKRLAIVLDGVVKSAPTIRSRIPTGEAMITTNEKDPDKSKDLAIVLRSGALPAPVKIAEERSIGPSLGQDSIKAGILAAIIGLIIVALFMIIYYSFSGFIAIVALILNLFFLVAALAGFNGTLTLPGIAGIALTIGMSVDANVLIFERIREELRAGKTPRTAIETGYQKVFRTIFDANLTTILTAVILYYLGTGPIRGFALTLMLGLIINFITAIYFTRYVYELFLSKRGIEKLYI